MKNKHLLSVLVLMITTLFSLTLNAQINTPVGAVVPFGSNPSYQYGIMPTNLPSGGTYGKSQDAADAYNEWKANYVVSCGSNLRVKFDEPNRTVSEGIAYGMLLSAYAADKATFDGLWAYYKANSNGNGFMHWRIDGCSGVSGNNGATDAELDATFALLIAENQWPSLNSPYDYSSEATTMMNQIKNKEIHPSSFQTINGDGWGFADNCRNPSYQSPPYYKEFATKNPGNASVWNAATTAGYSLINANADATTGLVSDWSNNNGVRNTCNGSPLGVPTDGYGYDACRNPWRMAQDVLWNNDAQAKAICTKLATYVNGQTAAGVRGPLYQNGSLYAGNQHNATFVSTFAMPIMGTTSANQTLMNQMYSETVKIKDKIQNVTLSGYFGNTLRCLSLFMMTGNFWKLGTTSNAEINISEGAINILNNSTYDFQNQQTIPPAASGKLKTFTIQNLGFQTLNLTGSPRIVLGGANASQFILTQSVPTSLAGNTSTTFTVEFRPTTTGSKTASLTILSNDPDEGTYVINLVGVGTANATSPKISVLNNNTVIANGGNLSLGTSSTTSNNNFRLKIKNTGDAPLNVSNITFTGTAFSLVSAITYPLAVAIGDSTYIWIKATSATATSASGSITLVNNDAAAANYVINLTVNITACGAAITTNEVYQDYDGNYANTTLGYANPAWTELFINPTVDTKNASYSVARFVRPATGNYNGVRYVLCGTTNNVSITASKYMMSMLVYSPVAGTPVQMNLKTDADVANTTTYPSRSSVTVSTTKTNQWERIYFDHSSAIGAAGIRHIEVFVDPLATKGAQTYYVDDIRLDVAPCLTDLPASKILNDYEDHRNISLPFTPPGTFNELAANPSATGVNTSAIVANYVRPNTGTPNANYQIIRYKICGNNLDLSAGKTIISMDIYSSKAGIPVLMSLKDGGTPNPTELFAATAKTTKVNTWETLYFDFTAALGNTQVKAIDLFIDPLATSIATVAERTYYIDNIKYADELPCTSQIPATNIFNDFNTNRYIDLAFNPTGPINEYATNPSATGINTSTTVANFVRAGTVAPDVVRYKACGTNFNFTGGKSVISVQIYSPNVGTEVIMSLKAANGTTEVAQGFAKTTTANSWQELSFDFSDMIGKTTAAFMDIIIDPNAKNIATAAQRTYNFDNIRYSNKPEIAVKKGAVSILTGDTLNVGTVALGDSIVVPLQLINNGGGDLVLSGTPPFKLLGADGVHYYVTTSPSFNKTISGGSSTGFSVVFKPTSEGTKISAIEIANNDSDENPFYINLKGSVLAPEINVKQATTSLLSGTGIYTFATSQLVGSSSTAVTFTIENIGTSVLNLSGTPRVVIAGVNASEFTVNQTTTTATVATAGTTTFTVTFSPTSVGAKTASISIANNDSDENPYTFTLNATAVAPEINVKQGATSIPTAGSYSFGSQSVGVASTAVTFTIENLGGGILNLTGTPNKIAISGANATDFTINQATTTATVAATTGTTTFTVVFTPSAAGLRNATLSIANNDADENPYVINISGTGAALPEINVKQGATNIASAGSYTFTPSVAVGSSSTAVTFTIENLGNAVLNLTGTPKVVVAGANASEFTVNETTTTATVAAAGTTSFTVTFTPTTVGAKAATLTIASNDADEASYVINLVATATAAPAPEINVKQGATNIASAGSYTFTPSVAVGSSSTAVTFTIENLGNAVLNLTGTPKVVVAGANASEFTVNETTTTATVAAAGTTSFTVTFTPTTVGAKAATLTIASNDADEASYVINLVATATAAPAPEINIKQGATDYLTASTYTFSSLTVGTSSTAVTFTIQNTGNAVLNLTGTPRVALSGTNASEFVVNQTATTATVAAAATTTFTVTFSPTTVGAKSAVLTIANNDSDEGSYVINLAGSATALPEPEINVKQATTTIVNTTGTYSFGNINIGTSSLATSFTIENLGGAVLNLTGSPRVVLSGADAADFTINQTATSATVAAAGNTNFTVTFTPTTPGVKTATVSIANNDTDENPYTFTLTGTAIATPEINVSQGGTSIPNGNSYTFTSVVSGTSGTAVTFTVENTGLGTLNVGTITKSGTNAAEFVLTQVLTPTVAGNSSTTFTVTFAPTTVGAKTATISIANDDSNENPYVITLIGTATSTPMPEVNVVQGTTNIANNGGYSFGNQVQSTASTAVTFTIENKGNADLTIGALTITGTAAADFALTQPALTTIPSSSSTTFTVTFTPSVIGTRSATINFTTNDTDENPYKIVVSGKGIAPSNGSEINVKVAGADIASNGTYDFKNQKPGTSSAPVTFTIENLGTNTLTVSSVLLSGGNYSEFSATTASSNSIAAGATATFEVYFAPLTYGTKSTTLYINNGDNDENPYVINIVGNGSDITGTQGLINESVEVFPNPTINDVNVSFDKTLNEVELTVFNSLGVKVMYKALGSTSFASTETIELGNLPAGVYIIEINSAEGKAIKRVVKN